MKRPLNVIVVGLGYFARFHLAAWAQNSNARIVGVCDTNADLTRRIALQYGIDCDTDLSRLLSRHQADIVDIVAPPAAHHDLISQAAASVATVICQKPFCTSIAQAEQAIANAAPTRILIHENFRFQPWHRAAKKVLVSGRLGQVFQARFALRPGDGRGPDAYLARQPAFQTMEQFLIRETGVHIFDLFRFFFGDIASVYADLERKNTAISGEDTGLVIMRHANGVRSTFDGNRLSDHLSDDQRRTMGTMEIEGEGGVLRLDGFGKLWFRAFGTDAEESVQVDTLSDADSFGGGCVGALIDHVVSALHTGTGFENAAEDYLHVMRVADAVYASDQLGERINITPA